MGLLVAALAILTGGRARAVGGVLEASGGAASWLLERLGLPGGGTEALTLGRVVLGRGARELDRWRAHERVHVAQADVWGPLFIPAYLVASAWVALCGGDPYRGNPFERRAYRTQDPIRSNRPR